MLAKQSLIPCHLSVEPGQTTHGSIKKNQKQLKRGFYGSALYMIFPVWAGLCWPGAMATLGSLAWSDSLYCTSIKHTALTSVQFSKIGLPLSLPTLCPTPIRLNYKERLRFYVTMTLQSIITALNLPQSNRIKCWKQTCALVCWEESSKCNKVYSLSLLTEFQVVPVSGA